ncbi:uncharacterized protein [Amphiura filiformis]|uniref:uncharacterized protein n=1 Tax=Amphiura filiformis TaxID=82378 RepID=UPI003B2167E6
MKYFVLVVVTVALVGGVSAAPLVKKSQNKAGAEDQLLELLSRYLASNGQTADEQADDIAAVLEEEREENEQIDQVVEKENGGVEALLKAVEQLQKKNEEREEDLENEERELELAILENIAGELLKRPW